MKQWCKLVLICYLTTAVAGSCTLNTDGKVMFPRRFFSKDIFIKPLSLTLGEMEKISAYCPGKMQLIRNYDPIIVDKTAELICDKNYVYITKDSRYSWNSGYSISSLFCLESGKYAIYENSESMPACDKYWTFGYGVKLNESFTKAAVCYDLPNRSLKSLNYIASSGSTSDFIDPEQSLATAQLLDEVGDLEQLSPSTGKYLDKTLLLEEVFQFHSLILDLEEDSIQKIFQIPFWSRLYRGNWKLFRQAFDEHVNQRNLKYNVFSGVSGQLEAPQQDCYKNKIYHDVPRYIWTYLRPMSNETEFREIVVIADNSPYMEYGHSSELLCNDTCKDIDWLHKYEFGRYHLMNSNGLMYCCQPEEVRFKLDFFPPLQIDDSEDPAKTEDESLGSTEISFTPLFETINQI